MAVVLRAGVPPPAKAEAQRTASLREAICRMVDAAAESNGLPATFLTRVLWQESGFRTDVTSPAGAAGVAQFMPQTAVERGLANPYDPGPAILQAARLLAELAGRFGNFGLAAAAYNAGAGRLSKWLHAQAGLPLETQLYVLAVTGHRVEEWRKASGSGPAAAERRDCLAATTGLARPTSRFGSAPAVSARLAAWQVRLDEFLAKAVRLQQQRPGTVPVSSRSRATEALCDRIRAMGMPCAVYDR
jgi:Transglycosylase SLT domain